jgi:hypothetical protein
MKTIRILSFLLLLCGSFALMGQDVNGNLSEARSSYSSGDLENSRFALQEALIAINQVIGKEILDIMPNQLGDLSAVENSDDVTGTNIGFAGLYVSREYKSETASASFQIVSDSPMLGAVSSLLSMSVFLAADPNQKRIKVDGYKALLTKNEDEEGNINYDVSLPFGNSMMNFTTEGIREEGKVTEIVGRIPVKEIVKTAQ